MYVLELDGKHLYDDNARLVNNMIRCGSSYNDAFMTIYNKVMCGSNNLQHQLDFLYGEGDSDD